MNEAQKRWIKAALVQFVIRAGAMVLLVMVVTAGVVLVAYNVGNSGQGGF